MLAAGFLRLASNIAGNGGSANATASTNSDAFSRSNTAKVGA